MATGIFVAVDGPKRTGKTSILDIVTPMLTASGLRVFRTKEPTPDFDLSQEESSSGLELARRLADDRRHHLEKAIRPALAQHDVVITDRYIASSLVFQVLDGVPFNRVWELNQSFLLPDLNIFLTVDERSSLRRLHERREQRHTTRLERAMHIEEESGHYQTAKAFLAGRGVHVAEIANNDAESRSQDGERLQQTATAMADLIKKARDQFS